MTPSPFFSTLLRLIALAAFCATFQLGEIPARAEVPPEHETILNVIRVQTEAMNNRDVTAYMATVHPDAASYENTKTALQELWKRYELLAKNEKLKVESVSEDEARVSFTQLTVKVSGPKFRNNRVTAVHILRKHNGTWKLFSTTDPKIEYLDE